MKPQVILEELEKAAADLGVRVSYEAIASAVRAGGMCRVKGEYRVIIDKRAGAEEKVTVLAEALSRLEWAQVDLSKELHSLLSYYSVPRAS